ncbi:MAG: YkvA family protein [Capsulimonadaceae bacterium]
MSATTANTVWPIIKRTPTYALLGLALARHPAIPQRHKLLLYSVIVYQVSPLHVVVTPIPIVGQVDCVVLLLLAIRQMVAHCPPAVLRCCLLQVKLDPLQFESDMDAILKLGGDTRRRIETDVKFAGRVVRFLGLRNLARLVVATEKRRNNPASRRACAQVAVSSRLADTPQGV